MEEGGPKCQSYPMTAVVDFAAADQRPLEGYFLGVGASYLEGAVASWLAQTVGAAFVAELAKKCKNTQVVGNMH